MSWTARNSFALASPISQRLLPRAIRSIPASRQTSRSITRFLVCLQGRRPRIAESFSPLFSANTPLATTVRARAPTPFCVFWKRKACPRKTYIGLRHLPHVSGHRGHSTRSLLALLRAIPMALLTTGCMKPRDVRRTAARRIMHEGRVGGPPTIGGRRETVRLTG